MSVLSLVAFFCYNRPEHTRRVLEALRANYLAKDTPLFIFSDAPKNEQAVKGVEEVRRYIHTAGGFKSVTITERPHNYGCAKNIIDGITQVVSEFGKVIIIEDDILTSPCFLNYINDALELYKDDDKAGIVTGFLPASYVSGGEQLPQTFFMENIAAWGWGTWRRVWDSYEYDAAKILEQLKAAGLEDAYNYGLKSRPKSRWLKAQAKGKVGTWDFQLDACLFLHGMLTLYSGRAFSNNIGFDSTGEHCGTADYDSINARLADDYESLKKIPVEADEHMKELDCIEFRRNNTPRPFIYRAAGRIWRILTGRNIKTKHQRKSVKVINNC